MTSLYETLGVNKTATEKEILSAYRAKARETHPDAGGSPDKFLEINLAYRILSDNEKRR